MLFECRSQKLSWVRFELLFDALRAPVNHAGTDIFKVANVVNVGGRSLIERLGFLSRKYSKF